MIEDSILAGLIHNETYSRKVLPHLKDQYFSNQSDRLLFGLIQNYTNKYNAPPSKEALRIDLDKVEGITEDQFKDVNFKIDNLESDSKTNVDYLVSKTEDFCKERAVYNAILESISIIDKKNKKETRGTGAIPQILTDALSVSFSTSIGFDVLEDYDLMYEYLHENVARIPFDIEYLNTITKGGIPRKTLSCLLSNKTGGGKSLCMCHFATTNLNDGYNVLYLTMELSKEEVSKRIYANLLNTALDDLKALPKESFEKKVRKVKEKTKGKLIVEEYATGSAHVGHFRHLLHELKIKKNFIPDVIYVDYINICSSSKMKMGNGVNSYQFIKAIAEELRGLAVETNTAIVTATQGTRAATSSSDIGLEDTSDSIALAYTLDLFLGVVRTEELDELNQILFKQLKNRFGPEDKHRRFVVGIERDRMMLFNAQESAQSSFKDRRKSDDEAGMDKLHKDIRKSEKSKAKFEDWN